MSYRIVEVAHDEIEALNSKKAVEIGNYESAYHAVEAMRRAFIGSREAARPNWYLVNSIGQILAGPDDIADMDS
ncbi:hypothetical protein [Haliangium ochraceum]|uniref:Uncharacterized protein n=1 Tax=Haliangium ochraceum (strain DSM 14365 / JCM 11303 / SMP-2) TaxID=502025 RepID=D0LXY5_HALO1|nr:hypothetical protein [Haliangium ochraceum]ACY14340.1 hypothetical protein Hoch_1792 [Haliangium ochraceum DSM 14365]